MLSLQQAKENSVECSVSRGNSDSKTAPAERVLQLQKNFMLFLRPILVLKNVSWGLEPAGIKLTCVLGAGAASWSFILSLFAACVTDRQSQTHQLKCCSSICTPWRALLCLRSVACSWEEISGYLLIKPRISDPSEIYMWLSKVSTLLPGYI